MSAAIQTPGAWRAAPVAAALLMSPGAYAQDNLGKPPADAFAMPDESVAKPMSGLLADGYEVITFSAGMGGFGYLLRRDREWVICTVNLYGDATGLKPYSRCQHLDNKTGK